MTDEILIKLLNNHIFRKVDNFLIQRHIKKRSKKLKKPMPCNVQKKILEYENVTVPNNWIRFTVLKDGFSTILNGRAVKPDGIMISPEWAARLILYDDENTKNAFLITVGHEATHNDGDFSAKGFYGKDRKFINWIHEVH